MPCCTPGYFVAVTVKLPVPFAVPPTVVIDTPPDVAPGITIATNCVPVLETTIAVTPPMEKAVGLVRLLPVMVTNVPTAPLDGVKEDITGACEKLLLINNNRIDATKSLVKIFLIKVRYSEYTIKLFWLAMIVRDLNICNK